jgi:steroid 5-alpha reductase family enzyme
VPPPVADALRLLALGWAVAAGLQLALWAVAQRTRNAGIVDVGWALSFTLVIGLFAWRARVPAAGWAPLAALVTLWSLRLGGYLIRRGAASGAEEGRYVELRRRWSGGTGHAGRAFFVFFQAQAALTALLSTAMVLPFVAAPWDGGAVRGLGAAVSLVGILGETLADAQLAAFKRDPAHRGQVCDVGLWGVSRHPNYFFEWCVWIGYAVYGLAFGWWGLIALAPQAIILASIFGVTGIPPTEAQSLRSRGDVYRAYQARVSKFVPRPPKRT